MTDLAKLADALRDEFVDSLSARGGNPEDYRFYAAAVRLRRARE